MSATRVLRARDLIGLPVVTLDGGEDVAEVRDVVYDAHEHRLVGFTLNKRGMLSGRLDEVLPTDALAAIGADAVMIDDERRITESGRPQALQSTDGSASVIGNRVISADGTLLGRVVGVIVSTGDAPAAVGYEIEATDEAGDAKADRAFVPISAQIAVSDDNLMLPAEATDFIRNDLAGFGAAVDDYRRSTLDKSTLDKGAPA